MTENSLFTCATREINLIMSFFSQLKTKSGGIEVQIFWREFEVKVP